MWRGMNVSFRDMLFLLVFAYLVIGAVALAHFAKNDEEQSKGQKNGSCVAGQRRQVQKSDRSGLNQITACERHDDLSRV